MKTILVGSTGFIGRQIKAELVKRQTNFEVVDRKDINLIDDISATSLGERLNKNTKVIFCSGIKKQLGDNFENWSANEKITNNLIKALKKSPPSHLVYLSSAAVFGEEKNFDETIDEQTTRHGTSFYAASKISAENILFLIGQTLSFPVSIVRPPLIYGVGDASRGYGPTGFCFNSIEKKTIALWGDGEEKREFIAVEDLAEICVKLSDLAYDGSLNIVSGKSATFKDIIEIINSTEGFNVEFEYRARTKAKIDHEFNPENLYKVLGNYKFITLADGVKKLLMSIKREF